jgi:hypothetical protein
MPEIEIDSVLSSRASRALFFSIERGELCAPGSATSGKLYRAFGEELPFLRRISHLSSHQRAIEVKGFAHFSRTEIEP